MTRKISRFIVLRIVPFSFLVMTFTACIKEPKAVDGVMIRLHEEVFGVEAPEHYHLDSLKEFYIQNDRLSELVENIEDQNTQAEALLLLDHFIQSDYSNASDLKNILVLTVLEYSQDHKEKNNLAYSEKYIPIPKTTATYSDSIFVEFLCAAVLPDNYDVSLQIGGVPYTNVVRRSYGPYVKLPISAVKGKTLTGFLNFELNGFPYDYIFEKDFSDTLRFIDK
jgi:hypothetical protein